MVRRIAGFYDDAEQLPYSPFGCKVQKLNLMQKVVRFPLDMHSVNMNAACLYLFVRRRRRRLGHDVDFDTLAHELLRQIINVRADSTNDPRRIFPRKHHHAHQCIIVDARRLDNPRDFE